MSIRTAPQIRHHIPEELLVAHAAGELPDAVALVVATHAALCRECTATIRVWEEIGGETLERLTPAPLPSDLLTRIESRIAAGEAEPAPTHPVAEGIDADDVLPMPLRRLAGGSLSTLRWQWRAPGAKEALLPVSLGGIPARIARLSTFFYIPMHTHREPEYTLILSGGLRDQHGTYERGDVHIYDEHHRHSQRVLPGAPCVCLVVNSSELVPLTLLGQVMARLFGA